MLLLYVLPFFRTARLPCSGHCLPYNKKPPAGSGGGAETLDLYEQNAEREQELRGEIGGEIEYA